MQRRTVNVLFKHDRFRIGLATVLSGLVDFTKLKTEVYYNIVHKGIGNLELDGATSLKFFFCRYCQAWKFGWIYFEHLESSRPLIDIELLHCKILNIVVYQKWFL